MSNFFEQELRKLFADGAVIHDPVFVGRACLGGLDRNRQVRAEFVTLGHADHYAALRLTLLDSNQGVVDKLTLRFKDVWGKQKIPNNPYLRDGVDPHIWVDGDRIDWNVHFARLQGKPLTPMPPAGGRFAAEPQKGGTLGAPKRKTPSAH